MWKILEGQWSRRYIYCSAILHKKRLLISKSPVRLRSKVWNREARLFGALDGAPLRAKWASGAAERTGWWQCGSSPSISALGYRRSFINWLRISSLFSLPLCGLLHSLHQDWSEVRRRRHWEAHSRVLLGKSSAGAECSDRRAKGLRECRGVQHPFLLFSFLAFFPFSLSLLAKTPAICTALLWPQWIRMHTPTMPQQQTACLYCFCCFASCPSYNKQVNCHFCSISINKCKYNCCFRTGFQTTPPVCHWSTNSNNELMAVSMTSYFIQHFV